ncbi:MULTISPECIES: TetR/AcrR family transcriptional regulator [Actinosynnema]|uniref:TetR/AcrR family transcriptional regulator n=1 Tax=Actinosynnema TaxID=40566 RepID=UPI0020A2C3C9|nr:TetR/AcrR family transcriptional regulator [Actinosynnema pretiosum]MCP2096439.1 transcriptional regulator, TetR family [Actinosynnema pretiosum]
MPRASQARAAEHRAQVLDAASRAIRAHGVERLRVQQVMADVGLTHGGFYRHFGSKDDLVAQAFASAFEERVQAVRRLVDQAEEAGDPPRVAFLSAYLSPRHRDAPDRGCPVTALASDSARSAPGSPLPEAFADGLRRTADLIGALDGADRERALVDICTAVGALTLARACGDDPLSDELLTTALAHLTAPTGGSPA